MGEIRRYRVRAALKRLFGVTTIEDRNGKHYYVTWPSTDGMAYRRWRWWNVRDWRPFRADPEGGPTDE